MQDLILGIEGGGTRTTWALLQTDEKVLAQGEVGAGNLTHAGFKGVEKLLKEIKLQLPRVPTHVGYCLAGCHMPQQRVELEALVRKIWKKLDRVAVHEDTLSGFYGAHTSADGVLVIAGTGSNVMAKRGNRMEQAGGWGHILADQGSAYSVAYKALRRIYAHYDKTLKLTPLAQAILQEAHVKSLSELEPLVQNYHGKEHVARFAKVVTELASQGNTEAKLHLAEASQELADNVVNAVKRVRLRNPSIALVGSMFEKNPLYLTLFQKAVHQRLKPQEIFLSTTPGPIGSARFVMHWNG